MKSHLAQLGFLPRFPRVAVLLLLGLTALLLSSVPTYALLTNASLRQEMEGAISKRVARDQAGRIYLLTIDRDPAGLATVCLQVGPANAESLADFSEQPQPVRAAGYAGAVLATGMVIDGQDRLHLVWTGTDGSSSYSVLKLNGTKSESWSRWENPVTGERGAMVLAPALSRVGDITLDSKGEPWLAWSVSQPNHGTDLYVGTRDKNGWQQRVAAEGYGLAPPSLTVDRGLKLILAWNDIYENGWVLHCDFQELARAPRPVPERIPESGRRPVVAEAGVRPLVIRENKLNRLEYFRMPGAEVPLPSINLSEDDPRFAADTLHSPQFCIDRHGVPWLFFIDSSRLHVFYTRWLGAGWGPIGTAGRLTHNSVRMEDSRLPIDRLSVEERMRADGSDFCLLIENTSTTPTAVFRRIAVPQLSADTGRKNLFFDLEEIASIDGLGLNLNSPRKQGPVLTPGRPGEFDSERSGPFVRVLKEEGRYRMWYAGFTRPPVPERWWEGYRIGYAESQDGRQFQRVKLGLASFGDQPDTNIIPDLPHPVQGMLYDSFDRNPAQRYKLVELKDPDTESEDAAAGLFDPWSSTKTGRLMVSPDGIHWTARPLSVQFPAGRPRAFTPQSIFYEVHEQNPERRYKLHGYSTLNKVRRGGSHAYSPDAIHWTASVDNPVLDPLARTIPPVRGGFVQQIHDTVVWQEGQYYLALYQYQHDKVYLDLHLAVSRDGENFSFVQPGQTFLPAGNAGQWDAQQVNPALPLIDDKEIKVYYGSVQESADTTPGTPIMSGVGLATLRLDGYTDLRLKAGRTSGSCTTLPIRPGTAELLLVNAECDQGQITVELLDAATGRVLPGYAAVDCVPLVGDGVAQVVQWKNSAGLRAVPGDFRICFHLQGAGGGPKFHSFFFQ